MQSQCAARGLLEHAPSNVASTNTIPAGLLRITMSCTNHFELQPRSTVHAELRSESKVDNEMSAKNCKLLGSSIRVVGSQHAAV
jgi:hypothetical protein